MTELHNQYLSLLEEIDNARPEQENALLQKAYTLLCPVPSDTSKLVEFEKHHNRFIGLLDLGGHDAAVWMLAPSGWTTKMAYQDRHSGNWFWKLMRWQFQVQARAPSMTLAILNCVVQAQSYCLKFDFGKPNLDGLLSDRLLVESVEQ